MLLRTTKSRRGTSTSVLLAVFLLTMAVVPVAAPVTVQAPAAEPPEGIELSPPFLLSDLPGRPVIQGEIDSRGRARVFAALARPGSKKWTGVHALLVDRQLVTDDGAVLSRKRGKRPETSLADLSLTRWSEVLEDTRWGTNKPGGGAEREIATQFSFTLEQAGMVRALLVGGQQLQGPTAWEINTPTGGAGGNLPYSYRVDQLAVTRQTFTGRDQFLFEAESGAPVEAVRIATDRDGAVHVLYERGEKSDSLRYARIPTGDFQPVKFYNSAWAAKPEPTVGRFGISVGENRPQRRTDRIALAADPDSGLAMIATLRGKPQAGEVFTRLIRAGSVGEAIPLGSHIDGVLLAAAGRDRFHALLHHRAPELDEGGQILYLRWEDGEWSRPTIVGSGEAMAGLISNAAGRALALWQLKGRLRARWVLPG